MPDAAASTLHDSVRRLWPGEGSKTEAWFVLDAAPAEGEAVDGEVDLLSTVEGNGHG